jgi:hypothetical protein
MIVVLHLDDDSIKAANRWHKSILVEIIAGLGLRLGASAIIHL